LWKAAAEYPLTQSMVSVPSYHSSSLACSMSLAPHTDMGAAPDV
jgi:hypothetical protein